MITKDTSLEGLWNDMQTDYSKEILIQGEKVFATKIVHPVYARKSWIEYYKLDSLLVPHTLPENLKIDLYKIIATYNALRQTVNEYKALPDHLIVQVTDETIEKLKGLYEKLKQENMKIPKRLMKPTIDGQITDSEVNKLTNFLISKILDQSQLQDLRAKIIIATSRIKRAQQT